MLKGRNHRKLRFIFSSQIFQLLFFLLVTLSYPFSTVFAGLTSPNYEIKDYSFGDANDNNSKSTNYGILGAGGENLNGQSSSTLFQVNNGFNPTVNANVPPAPTITNPGDLYYNKLHLVINTGGNPTDTKFAIAISKDNFATDTEYVQNDNTVGSALGIEDFNDYAGWGGSSGFNIIGLHPSTTYTVKVTAMQGDFSQSPYGPTAQAATVNPQLSFDIDVSTDGSETAPPYQLDIGALANGNVTTATDKAWIDISTNGDGGALVYINGANNGLRSSIAGYTISSVTNNLSSIGEGYGLRYDTLDQDPGTGPLHVNSPYDDQTSEHVGILDTNKRLLLDSSGQPVINGRASFIFKAKALITDPAESDYSDLATFTATGVF